MRCALYSVAINNTLHIHNVNHVCSNAQIWFLVASHCIISFVLHNYSWKSLACSIFVFNIHTPSSCSCYSLSIVFETPRSVHAWTWMKVRSHLSVGVIQPIARLHLLCEQIRGCSIQAIGVSTYLSPHISASRLWIKVVDQEVTKLCTNWFHFGFVSILLLGVTSRVYGFVNVPDHIFHNLLRFGVVLGGCALSGMGNARNKGRVSMREMEVCVANALRARNHIYKPRSGEQHALLQLQKHQYPLFKPHLYQLGKATMLWVNEHMPCLLDHVFNLIESWNTWVM